MTSTASVFSQTLQDLTQAKLDELSKKQIAFEKQKVEILKEVDGITEPQEQLQQLLDGVEKCFQTQHQKGDAMGRIVSGFASHDLSLSNIRRFLGEAKYDPSISSTLMERWKLTLLQKLDQQSAKLAYAKLYGELTNEWLASEKQSVDLAESSTSDDFEKVENRMKLQSRADWEGAVFSAKVTDQEAIEEYLQKLITSTGEDGQAMKAIRELRRSVASFEEQLSAPGQFNEHTLRWTIKGLLGSQLLGNEERAVLKDFLSNPVILNEVSDVLNLRMASLSTWSWGDQIQVEQRRRLNGSYRILLSEPLLQALLLQYIGVKWSVFFKTAFDAFTRYDGVFPAAAAAVPSIDRKRREFFLGRQSTKKGLQARRDRLYRARYFMSQLLDREDQSVEVEEGDEEADQLQLQAQQSAPDPMRVQAYAPPQGRMMSRALPQSAMAKKRVRPANASQLMSFGGGQVQADEDSESDEEVDNENDKLKNPMEAKQALLHLLSAEILINKNVPGRLTCFRAEFAQFNTCLPHSSIFAVLKFFGVSSPWVTFFTRFMKAPLAFAGEQPRQRQRGIPSDHTLSAVLGEALLFCLDLAVRSSSGHPLYRLYDDCWFWGTQPMCHDAWKSLQNFAKLMGLDISRKAGSVQISSADQIDRTLPEGEITWGFLHLDAVAGRFVINKGMMRSSVSDLHRQLSETRSVFAWVQVWNTYANTFFTTNFGRPAKCYGQDHIDQILAALQEVQHAVFANNPHHSMVASLKATLARKFGATNIPDGYIFFPTELGGLEVMNPFVELLQVREDMPKRPASLLDEFREAEKEAYRDAKIAFEKGEVQRPTHMNRGIPWEPEDPDTFMTFDEFVRYPEEFSGGYQRDLKWVFDQLLQKPNTNPIQFSTEVSTALGQLSQHTAGITKDGGINSNWWAMTDYWKWMAELYGHEMVDHFGGLQIVEPTLLPLGAVSMFRSGRVQWKD